MKKVFLLLLLICTLPAQAQTYWDGTADKNLPGEGTEASPYLISTPEQLAGLAARVNDDGEDFRDKFIQLANDIYLTELAEGKDTLDWEPIGHQVWKWGEETKYAYFRGTFDGAGHTIHNLYYGKGADFGVGFDPLDFDVELSGMDFSAYCKGLFCNVDGGTIKNLNLQNAMMSGVLNVALIATYLSEGSTVSNCHVQGKMHGTQVSLGGIVSKNEGLIENCTADIETDGAGMGGIVYENQTTGVVRDCSVTGTARCTAGNGGGVVNYNYGLIERCTASVDIQALYGTNGAVNSNTGYKVYNVHYAGGFVVYNWMGGIIRECYATGNLSSEGNSQLGGFGLYNYGRIESCYSTGLLKDITDYNTLAGSVGMAQFVRYNGEYAHHDGDRAYPGDCINCFTTSVCELRKDDNKDEGFYRNNCAAFLYEYNHGQAGFSDPYTSYSREIGCYWNKDGIPSFSGNYNCYLGQEYSAGYMQSQAFVDELNKLARFLGTSQWEYRAGQLPRATGVYTKDASDFFAGGDGSKENPYLIGNKEQLENMSYLVNQGFDFDNCYIKQTADIALNAPMEQWGEEMPTEWQPIGGSHKYELLDAAVDYPFKGNYDGDFHEVQNMYIDNLLANQGFFGLLGKDSQGKGVTIRNLGVTNAYVRAFSAGILAGKVLSGYSLLQCWTSGDAASQGSNSNGIGALAADLTERGRVLNCMSTAKLFSAGGVQYVAGTVDAMCNYRSWAGDSIVNYLYAGVLENLSNSAVPSHGFQYVENPFIDTDVAGDLRVNIQYNKTTAWLQSKECVNTYNDAVARWNAAHADNDELQLNYWEWREGQYPRVNPSADYTPGVTVAFESNGGTTVITRKVTEGSLMEAPARPEKDGMVFAGWYKDEALKQFFDFEHTVVTNDMTLYAKWLEDTRFIYDLTPFKNKFTNTYHIKTAAQLRGFAVAVNGEYTITKTENTGMYGDKYMSYTYTQTRAPQSFEGKTVVLDNDIFLNDTTDWQYWGHDGYAVPWKPIGSYTTGAAGGTQADVEFTGTFDGQGHSVYGMYIEMGAMPMYQQFYYGLFGITKGGAVIKNVGVRASAIDATDHQNELGTYSGAAFGGGSLLVGRAVATSISQCFTEGNIVNVHAEQSYVGGLIGQIDYEYTGKTAVDNSYSRVNITNVDGAAEGSLYGSSTSEKTITNCYLAGHVKGGSSDFYYDKELVSNAGTYSTGKTTNGMMAKSTYEGWDFETVWGRNNDINDGYPYLRQFYPDAPSDDPDPVKVTGIVLEEEGQTIEMFAGEPFQLHAHVVPEEAVSKGIIWSAQMVNNGIYYDANNAVNEDGLVNLPFEDSGSWYNNIHNRYYKITATTAEGDFKASCNVNVTYPYLTISIPEKRATANSEWVPVTRNEWWTLTTEWQYKVVAVTNYEGALSPVTWGLDLNGVATIEILSQDDMYNGKRVVTAVLTPKADADNLTIAATSEKGLKANKGYMIKYVAPQPVTVTAKSYSRVYGDENPTFEYTAEGAALDGEPEIICEATATSPVGEYPIIIRKGSVKNSNDSYVNGVLTITKAPLTITAASCTKKQYDPMPEFSVSFEGFKNNETEEVLTKQPVLSCEANEDSEPGVYDVVVSGAEAQNYEMKYVVGKLTVTEPDSYTLTYMVDGEEYKSFTVKYRESITPLEAPEKEGYTFSGWDGLPISMPAKDVVVKGSFTINSYTIAYVLDGEVYTIETLEYGAEIVPPVIPGLEEYTIWEDVPATMPAKDITIYGKAKDIIDSLTPTLYSGKGEVFDLKGRKLSAPQKGLNIIRMSDGTIRKVIYTPQGQAVK